MEKTLLIVTAGHAALQKTLAVEYSLSVFSSPRAAREHLEAHYRMISAVLIDAQLAEEEDGALLRTLREEPRCAFIPALIVADEASDIRVTRAFGRGAVDVIYPGEDAAVIRNRIANAIRLKDSRTFVELENMLRELPCNIYLKDAEARYVFTTHDWHHLKGVNDPNWTHRGKTDPEARKDTENAKLAYETDLQILKTGVGTHYTIEANVDNIREYIDITKRPVRDAAGNVTGIIALLENVTEQELLKKQLKIASITDAMTGLYNRGEIHRRIRAELNEENPPAFSLIMVDIDNFKRVNDTYGHAVGDKVIGALAEILRDGDSASPKPFVAGRWGGEEFMLLLPHIPRDTACSIAETIRQSFSATVFPTAGVQTISLGVTQVRPGDTIDALCIRVDQALYKAKSSGKNKVEAL